MKLSRLQWTLGRARAMPLAEFPHRLHEKKKVLEDRLLGPARLLSGASWSTARWPAWAHPAGDSGPLSACVDRQLSGHVDVLGERWARDAIDWDMDPSTGEVWERTRHGHDTGFRAVRGRDIKLAWEVHRLRHVQRLALAARVLGRPDARDAAIAMLSAWLDRPPFMGIAWASGIECAHRVAALVFLRDHVEAPGLERAILDSLRAHGIWIERYPSLYSSANNHRLAELAALTALAGICPASPERTRWTQSAAELEHLCSQLWTPDGGYRERSPSYQARSQEWLLFVRHTTAGEPWAPKLDDTLTRSAQFLKTLMTSTNHMPRIGDDDGSVVFDDGLTRQGYEASVLEATAWVLENPALLPRVPADPTRALAYGGTPIDGPRSPASSHLFRAHGITALRTSEEPVLELLFDHGELGLPPLHAHGHADKLAVWMSVAGHPMLIDSGTYRYAPDTAWRRHMRTTSAHNGLRIDGYEPAQPAGPFLWHRSYSAWLESGSIREGWATGVSDGFAPIGVSHRRSVTLQEQRLEIMDELDGHGTHTVEWWFHLHPQVQVDMSGQAVTMTWPGSWRCALTIVDGLTVTAVRGSVSPGVGASSTEYNQIETATTLCVSGKVTLPTRVAFALGFST